MNLIELLVFIGLIVLGGFLGAGIAELIGLIHGGDTSKIVGHGEAIGSVATFLGLIFWGLWFGKMDKNHPPCRCGKSDWKDFELSRAENYRKSLDDSDGAGVGESDRPLEYARGIGDD